MVAGFEVTSASRTRGRENIELEIRGPNCLQELRENGKGILLFSYLRKCNYKHVYISYGEDKSPTNTDGNMQKAGISQQQDIPLFSTT